MALSRDASAASATFLYMMSRVGGVPSGGRATMKVGRGSESRTWTRPMPWSGESMLRSSAEEFARREAADQSSEEAGAAPLIGEAVGQRFGCVEPF